jgi:hypothetical protein
LIDTTAAWANQACVLELCLVLYRRIRIVIRPLGATGQQRSSGITAS